MDEDDSDEDVAYGQDDSDSDEEEVCNQLCNFGTIVVK